jgi:hypothetical protein
VLWNVLALAVNNINVSGTNNFRSSPTWYSWNGMRMILRRFSIRSNYRQIISKHIVVVSIVFVSCSN